MNDIDICMGTGDIPTPYGSSDCKKIPRIRESRSEIEQMKAKGFVKDSTGSWFDPNNPVDAYFMDW